MSTRKTKLTPEQLERRKQQTLDTLGYLFGMDARAVAAMVPRGMREAVRLSLAEREAQRDAQKAFAVAKLKEFDPTWTPTRGLYDIEREQA